jgi:hypothetical protein
MSAASDPPHADAPSARSELDADGRKRPEFLLDYPSHPELEPLIDAFCRGNFAWVREHSPRVIGATDGPVRAAAEELRRRVEPERIAVWLYLGAMGFLVFVLLWAYTGH